MMKKKSSCSFFSLLWRSAELQLGFFKGEKTRSQAASKENSVETKLPENNNTTSGTNVQTGSNTNVNLPLVHNYYIHCLGGLSLVQLLIVESF